MGAILRVKELTIDRVVSIAAGPGPRRAGPVTASFKPALLGEYALRRGQGRTPPSSNIFSSHIRSQSGQTRTFETCHGQTCLRVVVSCRQTKWSYAGIDTQPWPHLASLEVIAIQLVMIYGPSHLDVRENPQPFERGLAF